MYKCFFCYFCVWVVEIDGIFSYVASKSMFRCEASKCEKMPRLHQNLQPLRATLTIRFEKNT